MYGEKRTLKTKLISPNAKIILSRSRIQRMFTIYSQRNTVHVNKISSRSFLDNNITELQARHN